MVTAPEIASPECACAVCAGSDDVWAGSPPSDPATGSSAGGRACAWSLCSGAGEIAAAADTLTRVSLFVASTVRLPPAVTDPAASNGKSLVWLPMKASVSFANLFHATEAPTAAAPELVA